jgi:hypothetical protein
MYLIFLNFDIKQKYYNSITTSLCFHFGFCQIFDMRLVYKYLIIIFVNLICYYRSLNGNYVFDDSVAILKNRDVYGELDSQTIKVSFMN